MAQAGEVNMLQLLSDYSLHHSSFYKRTGYAALGDGTAENLESM